MKNDLIERYIYAVIRHLPLKTRGDVEKELVGLISDMLEERCGDIMPAEKDIRVVLTELGSPEELSMKYSGDENHALISGVYLLTYKRVLKIVLPIVVSSITFANILTLYLKWETPPNPYVLVWTTVWQTIGSAIWGICLSFSIITLTFVISERKKTGINTGDIFAGLPPVPRKTTQINPIEPSAALLLTIFGAVFFLAFPQIIGAWLGDAGWTPVFAISVVRSLWLPIVLGIIFGIAKETVRLIEGQYTKRVVVVTITANLLLMVSSAVVFLNNNIMNPDFVSRISDLLAGESGDAWLGLLTNLNLLLLAGIIFSLIIEVITVSVIVWKYSEKQTVMT